MSLVTLRVREIAPETSSIAKYVNACTSPTNLYLTTPNIWNNVQMSSYKYNVVVDDKIFFEFF